MGVISTICKLACFLYILVARQKWTHLPLSVVSHKHEHAQTKSLYEEIMFLTSHRLEH